MQGSSRSGSVTSSNMEANTIPELVLQIVPGHNKPDCLVAKRNGAFTGISSSELVQTVEAIAARLLELGVKKGDRVGLLSESRPEWAYADLAIQCAGAVTVPIYNTLPAKQIEYIVNNSEMELLFVSNQAQLKKILE